VVLLNYDIKPVLFLDGLGKETDKFPRLARRFSGNGVIAVEGDMEVRSTDDFGMILFMKFIARTK
jgi:hypothetical protein